MFGSKQLEELAKSLFSTLPSSLKNLEHDIQAQFKDILQAAFTRMDLVTRDEFDVQIKVLARTREKIDALQSQVSALLEEKNKHIE
jgi:ubiquinone biosynthesis accessory factor UbiK